MSIVDGFIKSLAAQKDSVEQALNQLDDTDIHWQTANANSIAVLVKHLSGHLCSRFNDFWECDGERPDRNKAAEFSKEIISRAALLRQWNASWTIVFATLNSMADADLNKKKTLRGAEMPVTEYLPRVLSHTAYHTGQIVLLAKLYLGDRWKSLV